MSWLDALTSPFFTHPAHLMNHPSPISDFPADGLKRTIYVFVRTDITVEQQIVQAAHAAAEAGRRFYAPEHGIASLIVLAVSGPAKLQKAAKRLQALDIDFDVFFEPSWEMGHSALATRPLLDSERPLLKAWQLWKLPHPKSPAVAKVPEAATC